MEGSLNISGNAVDGRTRRGKSFGSGLFLQGSGSFTLAPGAGQTQTISDVIEDQTGVAGSGGSWSLVKTGAGTTILTGRNFYSGGTTVNAGALQGNVDSLVKNIVDNASLVFDQSTPNGISVVTISGTGGLTKTGAGNLFLEGMVTYSGTTTVDGGRLSLGNASGLATPGGAITLKNGFFGVGPPFKSSYTATVPRDVKLQPDSVSGFYEEAGASLVMTSAVSGGFLYKRGDGSVTLSGANTFAGPVIQGGELLFTSDANLGRAGGPIQISGGGSIGTTQATPAGSTISRGLEVLGNGGVSVALNPITWSGEIFGPGRFVKSGPGELELTGDNSYTGGTLVDGGTLRITSDGELGKAGTGVTLSGGVLRASKTFTTSRPFTLSLRRERGCRCRSGFGSRALHLGDADRGVRGAGFCRLAAGQGAHSSGLRFGRRVRRRRELSQTNS
jgi:autotransporter-associated beta strand protein